MNVAYLGPLKDYSGYGEANRHAAAALNAAGVHVIGQLVNYTQENSDFGSLGPLINELCERTGDYKIKIIHTTPDQYPRYKDPGVYHIGHFFWETDRVPKDFADGLNQVDEIWTGSEANKEAMIAGGVTKPIFIYPQAIETDREWPEKYLIPEFPDNGFLFYSIFEWTDRKNPEALLKAYYEEFDGVENVGLLIKTYFRNFSMANRRMIRTQIQAIRASGGYKNPPPVFLYLDLMDRQQIMRLHKTGDVFVSAHRGEGWGIPQAEAALAGNPVISTGYGGINEYFDKDTAKILPFQMVKLRGMHHSSHWYDSEQNWAEVEPKALRQAMRWAYDKPADARRLGERGRKFLEDRFNLERVGKEMADRLREIEKEL